MKILILARSGSLHHAKVIRDLFTKNAIIDATWRPNVIRALLPDVLITFDEHYCELALCAIEAKRLGIPVVLIRDGILEQRMINYESKELFKRNLKDVFISDFVLCLGKVDKEIIESWGNQKKCFDIGSPRIDRIVNEYGRRHQVYPNTQKKNKKRVLILSAKRPYFNEREKQITFSSYKSLICALEKFVEIELIWRVSNELADFLNLKSNSFEDFSGVSLHQAISTSDMVITSPSTAIIESMLFGIPVGVLDFHVEEPLYKSVWRFTEESHLQDRIREMLNPPEDKMRLQNQHLHSLLSNIGNSSIELKFVINKIANEKITGEINIDCVNEELFLNYEILALRSLVVLIDDQRNQLVARLHKIPFYGFLIKHYKNLKRRWN